MTDVGAPLSPTLRQLEEILTAHAYSVVEWGLQCDCGTLFHYAAAESPEESAYIRHRAHVAAALGAVPVAPPDGDG